MSVRSTDMRFFLTGLLLTVLTTSVSLHAQYDNQNTVNLVSRARKSVVSIEARMSLSSRMGAFGKVLEEKLQAANSQQRKWYVTMGSGVIWDDQGYIITTNSTVQNASEIIVKCADSRSYGARLVGSDEISNLAVLKIDQESARFLTPIPKRQSSLPEGSWLVLMGYGYGGIPTVSPGMSGVPPEDFEPGRHWFQFTAPLRPGNSGGALVDASGNLAGIVLGREEDLGFNAVVKMLTGSQEKQQSSQSNMYSSFGLGVPITLAEPIIDQIIRDGRVVRGWLGISVRKVTEISSGDFRIIVVRVVPESPADQAGIRVGDSIHCMNTIEINDPIDLGRFIQNQPPGTKITIDFDRQGEQLRTELVLRERPDQSDIMQKPRTDDTKNFLQKIHVLEGHSEEH